MAENTLCDFVTFLGSRNLVLKEETKLACDVKFFDGTKLCVSASVASAPCNTDIEPRFGIRFMYQDIDGLLKDAATIDFGDAFSLLSATKYFVELASEMEDRDSSDGSYSYCGRHQIRLAIWKAEHGRQKIQFNLNSGISAEGVMLTTDEVKKVFRAIKSCRDCLVENGAK